MTWIEIASDAVKIGLGAVIGGLFAFFTANQSHKHRKQEEYSKRRRDQLEKISESFDKVSCYALEFVSAILAVSGARLPKKAKESLLIDSGHDPIESHEIFMTHLTDLHSIEARLALLALPHIAEEVESYRHALSNVSTNGVGGRSNASERAEIFDSIHYQRTIILTLMAQSYKDA